METSGLALCALPVPGRAWATRASSQADFRLEMGGLHLPAAVQSIDVLTAEAVMIAVNGGRRSVRW